MRARVSATHSVPDLLRVAAGEGQELPCGCMRVRFQVGADHLPVLVGVDCLRRGEVHGELAEEGATAQLRGKESDLS